ncbi:hypothetical protein B0A48_18716 [Cryoendolithus antarcticus]|uniref:Uncharacterized protein n=1 Tax=Cryoendolithus antarcticus TaxID=1507870 RepID=A0A1V8S7N3_9PEZI|nr:hypothetical protein B0A48_18716 [Cryoendolithus antarcticus]
MATQPNVPPMLSGMSREQWQEGAWRIPVADQSTNEIGMRIRATGAAKAGWEAMKLGEAAHTVWDRGPGKSALNLYVIAIGRLRGRRLAGTSQGLVGLMPADVEIGDIVAIIVGAESPMLLRPGSEGGAYKIVGECYVYGIMDGEMIGTDTVFTDIDVC